MAPLILWSALVIVVYGVAYGLISSGASRLSDVNVNGRVLWQSECSELIPDRQGALYGLHDGIVIMAAVAHHTAHKRMQVRSSACSSAALYCGQCWVEDALQPLQPACMLPGQCR